MALLKNLHDLVRLDYLKQFEERFGIDVFTLIHAYDTLVQNKVVYLKHGDLSGNTTKMDYTNCDEFTVDFKMKFMNIIKQGKLIASWPLDRFGIDWDVEYA